MVWSRKVLCLPASHFPGQPSIASSTFPVNTGVWSSLDIMLKTSLATKPHKMPILCFHHSKKYNVSNKCFSHLRYQHRRQNAVIQTCLFAPTLGARASLNQDTSNFPRFPQVKQVNTNKHQEQTPKTRVGQKIACAAAKIMASKSPP